MHCVILYAILVKCTGKLKNDYFFSILGQKPPKVVVLNQGLYVLFRYTPIFNNMTKIYVFFWKNMCPIVYPISIIQITSKGCAHAQQKISIDLSNWNSAT